MGHDRLHQRAREHGANPLLYGFVRVTFQAFFLVYFRFVRIGREHVPKHGPVILASNHRSFLDPFVIACMANRPMYYVAKKEIFQFHPVAAWLLLSLGAFPVDRGAGDADFITTAQAILARGDIVLIFPEGTRTRPGPLGRPRRGVGRLALQTGVPVVPVAVIGTEAIRRGWRIRPHKVRIRAGRPLRFPRAPEPSPTLAGAATDRIWPCVMLQWEWLGGLPPIRRVAIIGAGAWGTSLAVCLARAGVEVDLGCRTPEQAQILRATRENARYLPRVTLPSAVRVVRSSELSLRGQDVVCLAVPARALPAVLAAHGEAVTRRTGVVLGGSGVVPPLGTLPSAFAGERCPARALAVLGGPARPDEVVGHGGSVVIASLDGGFARQLGAVLGAAALDVSITDDVAGIQLAGVGKDVVALAAAAASSLGGPSVAGTVAGQLFSELDALARAQGGRSGSFSGLAGTGALVASIAADTSLHRQAGELLAQGVAGVKIAEALGRLEALDSAPLLPVAAHQARVQASALDGLAALVEGRIKPEQWAATVTEPRRGHRSRSFRAA